MTSINNPDDVLLISDDDSGDEVKAEPAQVNSLNSTQAEEPEGRRISRRKKAKVYSNLFVIHFISLNLFIIQVEYSDTPSRNTDNSDPSKPSTSGEKKSENKKRKDDIPDDTPLDEVFSG